MYETTYVLLFAAGALLSTGAYLGYARGYSAILGMFVWFVVGNASTALVVYDGAGGEHLQTNVAMAWLAYGNAAMHFVTLLIHVHDWLTDDDAVDSPDEVVQQLNQASVGGIEDAEPRLGGPNGGTDS